MRQTTACYLAGPRFRQGWCGLLLSLSLALVWSSGAADAEDEGPSPMSVPGAQTIATGEARQMHLDGVTFVDVRNPRLFARRHIPGAHHLDLYNDFDKAALLRLVAVDQPLVLYCSGIRCSRSSQAAAFAVDWGYVQVKYYREGLAGWRDAGLPLDALP